MKIKSEIRLKSGRTKKRYCTSLGKIRSTTMEIQGKEWLGKTSRINKILELEVQN